MGLHGQDEINDPCVYNDILMSVDEVESLTAARKSAVSGSEPSDAIRVVNALLTQLDLLKRHSNVLILTTSNITEAIDVAFVDRADIKQYVEHTHEFRMFKMSLSYLFYLFLSDTLDFHRVMHALKFCEAVSKNLAV